MNDSPLREPERGGGLTAADVVRLYELLLGRTPSREEVHGQLAATSEWQALLAALVQSEEYALQRRVEPAPVSSTVNIWHPEMAKYAHKAGTLSADESTLVGTDGWLFLVKGTNSVYQQYQNDFALEGTWTDEWSSVVAHRRSEAARLKVDLALVIVPDKLSVMHEHLPEAYSLKRPSPAMMLAQSLDLVYPLSELQSIEGGAFLRTDTHLSLTGNRVLAAAALAALGITGVVSDTETVSVRQYSSCGDLGHTMVPPVVEIMSSHDSLGRAHVTEDNLSAMSEAGRHVGTRRVYANPDSPDTRTAIVFGDSFSLGKPGYQGLAWYFAQHFREVHFIWSPFGWDSDYVLRSGAGVVLCETAERFVPRAPKISIDAEDLTSALGQPAS